MKMTNLLSLQVAAVVAAMSLCLAASAAAARVEPDATKFPFIIQPELGATEFASGDSITITSLRGDRKRLEPGGNYRLEGSYTLVSAENADLAWFATSRAPSGSTPVTDDQHVKIQRGTGTFVLQRSRADDSWFHISFYTGGHSHGGLYFGEQGVEATVLRTKGWSDFTTESQAAPAAKIDSAGANAAILAYLGNPIAPPSTLDPKYTPANLKAAFKVLEEKAGWQVQKLAVDESEFPFLVYGVLSGRHELDPKLIRQVRGYDYGGSVRGSTDEGETYFSLNMIPSDQYPSGQAAACNRRLMVRLQMLADSVKGSK
jgi:hypothetical protein